MRDKDANLAWEIAQEPSTFVKVPNGLLALSPAKNASPPTGGRGGARPHHRMAAIEAHVSRGQVPMSIHTIGHCLQAWRGGKLLADDVEIHHVLKESRNALKTRIKSPRGSCVWATAVFTRKTPPVAWEDTYINKQLGN